jgi:hypothetical protein
LKYLAAHTSFNPPEPPVDHWGLNNPLPKFEPFKLGRRNGVVTVLGEDGDIIEELKPFYMKKDQFLEDYAKLITLIADGPL